jgi:hypothetical protein
MVVKLNPFYLNPREFHPQPDDPVPVGTSAAELAEQLAGQRRTISPHIVVEELVEYGGADSGERNRMVHLAMSEAAARQHPDDPVVQARFQEAQQTVHEYRQQTTQ